MTEEKIALLIIDVQSGFFNKACESALEEINFLIESQSYDLYLATCFQNNINSPFVKWLNWSGCMPESNDCEILLKDKKIKLFNKKTYGSLNSKVLYELKSNGISKVHICGFDTNMCVFVTAVQIFDEGTIEPFVLSKGCASHSGLEFHQSGLKLLEKAIGKKHIL